MRIDSMIPYIIKINTRLKIIDQRYWEILIQKGWKIPLALLFINFDIALVLAYAANGVGCFIMLLIYLLDFIIQKYGQ